MNRQILIGADPEFFLKNTFTGRPTSAIGLIGGTKYEPRKISSTGHAIQEDNVMVEFNVPPAKNWVELHDSIKHCIDYVKSIIPKNLEVHIVPSAEFMYHELLDEQAQQIGCDPDYNAWTLKRNKPGSADTNFRCSGGHIHIGYPIINEKQSIEIVKAMDLFLGVPSIILDTDKDRRKMYGKAGAHRIKSYGVEYRVLSNFWITKPELIKWAYENSIKAVNFALDGNTVKNSEYIIKCIDNSDKSLAKVIIDEYKLDILNEEYIEI